MRTKSKLSQAERLEYEANVKRLRDSGLEIEQENTPWEAPTLRVDQVGGPNDSVILAAPRGGYVIAAWLRIIPLKSGISICGRQITLRGWDDPELDFVEAPFWKNVAELEYETDDVLNDRITGRTLGRVKNLEGVIIAQSCTLLPERYCSGIPVDVELIFVDQFDNCSPLCVQLSVIRDDKQCRERARPGRGPYGDSRTGRSNPPLRHMELEGRAPSDHSSGLVKAGKRGKPLLSQVENL
jgi:hypothetical protein